MVSGDEAVTTAPTAPVSDIAKLLGALHDGDVARRATQIAAERAEDVTLLTIARSLEDDVDQALRTASVLLHNLRGELGDNPHANSVGRVEDQLHRAASRLQRLILELRPPKLERLGLAATLQTFLQCVEEETGVTCQLVDELHHEPPAETQINLFRIAYEAIINTRRYAHATRVVVEIREYAGGFMLRVIDDGRGFDRAAIGEQEQLGFLTMKQRAELRDGWWQARSSPGEGTTIEVWTPGAAPRRRAPAASGDGAIVVE